MKKEQHNPDVESADSARNRLYQPGCVISLSKYSDSHIHSIIRNAPRELVVKWDGDLIKGAKAV